MNGECGTNDSANLDPTTPTSCDVSSIGGNPQLSANGGCQPPVCDAQPVKCTEGSYWSLDLCRCVSPTSPIILDIDGKGFNLTNAAAGVLFDISGTGHPIQMGWTAPGANNAFLCLPDSDGKCDDGKDLFGNFAPQPLSDHPNGFIALAVYDDPKNGGNGDGVIDSRDAIFSSLRLWIDENHDGISQPEEIHTLASLGVNSISLQYKLSEREDKYGNLFRYRAAVNPDDADASHVDRKAYDVFFVTLSSPGTARNSIPLRASPTSVQKCPVPGPSIKGGMLSTTGTL